MWERLRYNAVPPVIPETPDERRRYHEAALRRDSEAILDRAEGEVQDSGVRYTREALAGPVARTLAGHAERTGCDAIVMGRHGMTASADFLAGSVALKVLQASKLPVMLVR